MPEKLHKSFRQCKSSAELPVGDVTRDVAFLRRMLAIDISAEVLPERRRPCRRTKAFHGTSMLLRWKFDLIEMTVFFVTKFPFADLNFE